MKKNRTFRRSLSRFVGVIGAISLAGVLLTGCTSSGSSDNANGDSANSTTITFWQYYGERSDKVHGLPLYDFIGRFEKANPDIKVNIRFVPSGDMNRILLQAAGSKKLPTVALIHGTDTSLFANSGIAKDISSLAKIWGQQDEYYPSAWASTQVDKKTYALPAVGDLYGLYHNKTLLEDAGLTPPKTWDELEKTAKKLSVDGRTGLAISGMSGAPDGAYPTILRFLAEGGDVSKIDSPAGKVALTTMKDLVSSGAVSQGFSTWSEDNVETQFATGQAALMINSAGYVTNLEKDYPDLTWDVAPLPDGSSEAVTYLQSENLVIGTDATDQQTKAAWKLLKFMQEPKELAIYLPARSKLPLRTDVPVENPVIAKFAKLMDSAFTPTGELSDNWAQVLTAYQTAMSAAVSGSATTAGALTAAQDMIDQALAQSK